MRYDMENADSLCYGCHMLWGGDRRREYEDFKIKQLGQNRFNALVIRANTPTTRFDPKWEVLKLKALLKLEGIEV